MSKFKFASPKLIKEDYEKVRKKLCELTGLDFKLTNSESSSFYTISCIKSYPNNQDTSDKNLLDYCKEDVEKKNSIIKDLLSYGRTIRSILSFNEVKIYISNPVGIYFLATNFVRPNRLDYNDVKIVREKLEEILGLKFQYTDNKLVSKLSMKCNKNLSLYRFLEYDNISVSMPKAVIYYFAREIKRECRKNYYKFLIENETRLNTQIIEEIFNYIIPDELPKTLISNKKYQEVIREQRKEEKTIFKGER